MPSTFTTRNRFTKQGTGENENTWGDILNTVLDLVDEGMDGLTTVDCSTASSINLTANDGAADESRRKVLRLTGTPSSAISVIFGDVESLYFVDVALSAGTTVTLRNTSGTGVTVSAGSVNQVIYCDGTSTTSLILGSPAIALAADENLSELTNVSAARDNLGLGGMAQTSVADYYTKTSADAAIESFVTTNKLPSREYFTADGTHTVSAGISVVRVYVAGAGGGGGSDVAGSPGGESKVVYSTTSVSAGGGGAGLARFTNRDGAAHGTASGGDININGGGAAGGKGGGRTSGGEYDQAGTGGNGGYAIKDIPVSGGSVLNITVGTGGSPGTIGAGFGIAGVDGWVIVEW